MANIFKTFTDDDIQTTKTLLHEAIPLTGSLISGTYGTWPNEENIKNYSHGMFQSVYDYPYLSSSANQIFDITVGYSANSGLSGTTNVTQQEKKINIYNQMAAVLMGHDVSGNIRDFDQDGNIAGGGTKHLNCIFLNFARLLVKDEIKKGSFTLKLGCGPVWDQAMDSDDELVITDSGAENNYRVNSPAGEYGILSCSLGGQHEPGSDGGQVGLIFYQAGVVVLSSSVFTGETSGALEQGSRMDYPNHVGGVISQVLTGSSISGAADAIRHRINDISFNNTTELNSTIHFCRANAKEFNYSSNPTYLSSSKIRTKNNSLDNPTAYVTTVGLYSQDNELLAVGKLSEPLKKSSDTEFTLRLRLDY